MRKDLDDDVFMIKMARNSLFVSGSLTAISVSFHAIKTIEMFLDDAYDASMLKASIRVFSYDGKGVLIGSTMLGAICNLILTIVLFTKERLAELFINAYNGSLFMKITEAAVINSRIFRWVS
jgi:hypothetical protein